MKPLKLALSILLAAVILAVPSAVYATAPTLAVPSGLSIAELKITGVEFILLENNTGSTISSSQLSNYWLNAYNNADPTASGVSSSSQQLPAASLAPGQTLLLSDGGATCGAAVTDNLSLSLNDSGGFLEVVQVSFLGGVLSHSSVDSVAWNTSTNGGTVAATSITIPTSTTAKVSYADYRFANSSPVAYWWQPASVDSTDGCQLDVNGSAAMSNPGSSVSPGGPPPAVVTSVASFGSGLPAGDVGLALPIINEVLPNPASPQTDADDEFIELYNPNAISYDLSGFTLEIGLTTKHDFTFDAGTTIDAKGFKAFYSADTHLSLSNGGSQVWLLDPAGNVLSQSDVYGTAPDGQSWALASSTWYWTATPTPGAANLINGTPASKLSKSKTKTTPTVNGTTSTLGANTSSSGASTPASQVAPIHSWTLAGVGTAAVAYAAYEYRVDLANHFHRFRKYAQAWRATRK